MCMVLMKFSKTKEKRGQRCRRWKMHEKKRWKTKLTTEDREKVWKNHMENIMNKENEWDHMSEVDVVEGPIEKVTQDEVLKAVKAMKLRKAAGPSEVSAEMITASGEIGISIMQKLRQNVLVGGGMPEEWKTSVVVSIFKGKGDAMSCGSY